MKHLSTNGFRKCKDGINYSAAGGGGGFLRMSPARLPERKFHNQTT